MRKFHSIFIFLNLLISSPLFADFEAMRQLHKALPAIALSFVASLKHLSGQREAEEAIKQEAQRRDYQARSLKELQAPKHTAQLEEEETRLGFETKALLPIHSSPELKPDRIKKLIEERKALESKAYLSIEEERRLNYLNQLLKDTPWDDSTNEKPKETKFSGKIQTIPGVYQCPITVEEAAAAFPEVLSLGSPPQITEPAQTDNSTAAAACAFPVVLLNQAPAGKGYSLIRSIGSGSSGTAFLATRNSDGKKVIAKITDLSGLNGKKKGYARSEIACMSECEHFAIINHIENHVSMDGNYVLLVMELADAGDLGRQIKARAINQSYFQEHEVAFLFLQVLLGVNYLHDKRMLHRDIKSANVFLMSRGIVKLGDFGFTQKYDETVSSPVAGTFCGTPYYLAPELWNRLRYGRKADVWSLGVLLYEIAALKRPFVADEMPVLMEKVLLGTYDPLPSKYSEGMHDLVKCLLRANPEERPNTHQVLAHQYMVYVASQFEATIRESTQFSVAEKENIVTQLAAAKASASPVSVRIAGVQYSGTISKSGPRGWKQRFLALAGEKLTISLIDVNNSETKSLSIRHIVGVERVSREQVEGRENVFVINLEGAGLQFQAPSKEECDGWVKNLNEAIDNFHQANP